MSTRNPPAHRYGTTALALFCAATLPGTARAQAIASPFGTISQRVDSTTMTVEYYRPSVRGRTIFGRLVRWGDLWTPGANWATTLEVDHDVQIENRPLPHGKYSLWLIPAQSPDSWTVVLSRSARRFHVVKPVPADDQLRFKVLVDSTPHTEVLTFSFPEVNREGATLQLRWAETAASLHLATELNRAAPAPAHPWSSYTGIYEVRGVGEDSTAPGFRYEIIERGTGLWVR
ncbi:MAG TPA: DUF2911 domain-containing protein, partial [Gemmatimonadales bacterium]|nr:DUF2911 domain-containing protein [Gemmatimonadales bacterium]